MGCYYLDFLISDKIVLELKSNKIFNKRDFAQIKNYLKANKIKLGILASFAKKKVIYARVINEYESSSAPSSSLS